MARKREFRVGDRVMFPEHGAGRVVATCEREVLGQKREYYQVKLNGSDMKVLVPV
ncbi:MAG: hypothetical protein HY335_07820, partial [Deinococcus sp.]|nr:hypothetical protein [Deinococcus sp.]